MTQKEVRDQELQDLEEIAKLLDKRLGSQIVAIAREIIATEEFDKIESSDGRRKN